MPRTRPIVLITDFGPDSAYVGQMKLVLHRLAPGAAVLDLAHDLPAHDVAAAALNLESAARFLPDRCVVVLVVDPGVGSKRRIVAARYGKGLFVLAPDNGALRGALGLGTPAEVRVITNEALHLKPVSPVFHGRDIFAPAAARLARGLCFKVLGPLTRYSSLEPPPWRDPVLGRSTHGVRVIHIDRFGNLITNLSAKVLGENQPVEVRCRRRRFPFATHYEAVGQGRPLSLIGSHGRLELALREASAARKLGIVPGVAVNVTLAAHVG